jgi:hypothetical protein
MSNGGGVDVWVVEIAGLCPEPHKSKKIKFIYLVMDE